MRQYLKNKHFKNTLIVILICLIAVVATTYCISESNARKEEVKSLVRKYDLTTEENSSATLIVKSRLSNKQLEELGAEQIVKYGEYKVVKFNSQEDMEERLAELQEQKVEVEVDTLVDVATILSETTSTKTNETTPSTPEKGANTLQQYLENNPSKEIVKVAIIDTGIDKENELFKDRIIDTQLNYSTTGEENDTTDDYGHGTTIAEIIAKKTDSNIKLMPIKVANKNGKSTVLSVYMAINEAISQGADVINISMNTFSQSDLLREAIDKANEVGIKVVVSSGNLGIDVENIAPSNIESAIVVGAVHSNLDYEGFSNYGDTVDYCSYGVYDSDYGTSISAAHISAVIAALESTGVKPTEIEGVIDSYIKDLGEPGKDKYYGKGFISLYTGDECFTLDGDEEAKVNANRRKEMLQKLLDADWKSMTDAELNALFSDTHYDIIGYFLKTLSEEDFNEIISRDTQLQDPITVGTAFIINDVSEIENVNWPDLPDKEYDHMYEYCLTLCDDSMSTSAEGKWTLESVAIFFINLMDYGVGKGDTRYRVTISNLVKPLTMMTTLNKQEYSEAAKLDGDTLDEYLKNTASGYACTSYVIHNENGGYDYSLGASNKRLGTAYVLSEEYGDNNALRWQGIYIRGLQYKIPAYSIMNEEKPSDIGQGRLNIGYITHDTAIKGDLLDKNAYEKDTWDTIDVECNSYNCGLAPIRNAYHNSTLILSVNPCKESIFIDPNGGAVKYKKGNGYTKKYNLDTKGLTTAEIGDVKGIQWSSYKTTGEDITVGKGKNTSNIQVIPPSGKEFDHWEVAKHSSKSKGTLGDKGTGFKYIFKSLGLEEKVILRAVYEDIDPPTPPPTNTPKPTEIPDTDTDGKLKVYYKMYNAATKDYDTFESTTSDITLTASNTVVGNSKMVSANIYPSTYYNAVASPSGYEYSNAKYTDYSFKVVTRYNFSKDSSGKHYTNKSLKTKKGSSGKHITEGGTVSGYIHRDYLTSSQETGNKYKRQGPIATGTYIRVPTWHNYEGDSNSGEFKYKNFVYTPLTDVNPVDNEYVYYVSSYNSNYIPDYTELKYDLDCSVDKKDDTGNELNDDVDDDKGLKPIGSNKVYRRSFDLSTNNPFVMRNAHSWKLFLYYIPKIINIEVNANGGYWATTPNNTLVLNKPTFGDCEFRYNISRNIIGQNYVQDGDTSTVNIDATKRDIYKVPVRTGYTLDWEDWEIESGNGSLVVSGAEGNKILTYNPKNDLNTVKIKANWIPNTYKLKLHVRKPNSTRRQQAADEIITGVDKKNTSSTDDDELISIIESSTTNYKELEFTYEEPLLVCAGDGTQRISVEGFAVPYCKGFELIGFSTSADNYVASTNVKKTAEVNGITYWEFDGKIAGDVDLYPIWKEKPLTYTIDTNGVPLIDKNTDSINGNVTVNDSNTSDELDVFINGDKLIQEFWFDDTNGNTFNIQDTPTSSSVNTILGNLTKYGYQFGTDEPRKTSECKKGEWYMIGSGEFSYTKHYFENKGEHTITCTNKYTDDIGTSHVYDGDITVVANWIPNKHTLTIDGNGGTFQLSNGSKVGKQEREISYGQRITFASAQEAYNMNNSTNAELALIKPVSQPQRYGYDFIGWKIKLNETGASDDKKGRGSISIVDEYGNTILVNSAGEVVEDEDTNTKYLEYFVEETALSTNEAYYYLYDNEPNKGAGNDGYNWDGDVIIEAQWKPHQHTLTIDNNGGKYCLHNGSWTETDIWSKTFTFGQPEEFATRSAYNGYAIHSSLELIQTYPVKYGYTFNGYNNTSDLHSYLGWKVSELSEDEINNMYSPISLKNKEYNLTTQGLSQVPTFYYNSRLDKDVTITAQWTPNLHNLTVDPNGGEFYRPTNENGVAIGWTKEKYTRKFAFNKVTTFSTKNKVTRVDYKKDDTDPSNVTIDGAVSEPWRRGYTFTGWSNPLNNSGQHITTNDTGEKIQNKVIDTDPSSTENGAWKYTADYAGDVTISAIWNNGQTTESGTPYGNAYTILYQKGLTDCSDDKLPAPNPQSANYDKDVTLHTKGNLLGRSYKVTLDSGLDKGGTGIYIAEDREYRDVSTRDTYSITANTISGNLEFSGWDVQKETNTETGDWAKNSEDGPEYKLYTYETVNYAGGQTVTKANFTSVPNGQVTATARYSKKNITLYTPSMKGYEFQGWYTEPNGGGTKVSLLDIDEGTSKYEITLYAYWKPIKYSIRYNGNGHWNTTQGVYTQELTFDKTQTLTACKFTRNATNPGYTYNGNKLAEGYSFVGWEKGTSGEAKTPFVQTAIGTGKSITYTDKASGIFNLTATKGDIIDLYAIWKKSLSVAFDLNGGLYDGKSTIDKLETTVWNSTYQHTFDITNYFGTVTNNGLNSKLGKVDEAGNIYRFLGWSLNKNAVVPDSNLIVYDSKRANHYTIHDDKTLYAVWEKILIVNYDVGRTKGEQESESAALPGVFPSIKNITAITSNPSASVIIKPGEEGYYKLDIAGTPTSANAVFSETVTNMYTELTPDKWKDKFNQPDSESKAYDVDLGIAKSTSGLNKKLVPSRLIKRTFHVPVYFADAYSSDYFTLQHTIQQESYYYKNWVSGKDKEEIKIKTLVYIDSSPGDGDRPSTLDELKSLIKTKIVQ